MNEKIAGLTTTGTNCASSGQTQCGTRVDAGGHIHLIRLLGHNASVTAACCTWSGDNLTESTTTLACLRCHHLAEQTLTNTLHLTTPIAIDARHRFRSGSCSGSLAVITSDCSANIDRDRCAENRLVELQIGDDLEILATRWTRRTARCAEGVASEERIENVSQAARSREEVSRSPT